MSDLSTRSDEGVARQAAAWIARRDRGLTPGEERSFAAWQSADPRHGRELHRMSGAWTGLGALRPDPALHAMADAVIARARRSRRRRWLAWAPLTLGAAAALALGFVGWTPWRLPAAPRVLLISESVRVLDSTLRRVPLPDGSMAELNGSSRIEEEFSPRERRVRLVEGEAHFIVAKDPDRAFYVTAGSVTVRAVGTAFNVRVAPAAIEVLVTEGVVQLEHGSERERPSPAPGAATAPSAPVSIVDRPEKLANAELSAGQKAVIERTGAAEASVAINAVGRAEIDEALGWQSTRLVFNNTPLNEVVASFNQFNKHQLTLGDPKLAARSLTGTFRADNLEGFKRLLRASIDVKAEMRTATETVLFPMR